ncbi:hypothetical protein HanHA300_Chr04g0157191 [Helianthus annuus]|nr:hypothetical protein HanHA300_Chr04g0157191 [Helianthus annuus]KAJ0763129.1 hypothetical protein HanOQP8_Chr04g0168801 [Helianthus annuus]
MLAWWCAVRDGGSDLPVWWWCGMVVGGDDERSLGFDDVLEDDVLDFSGF